MHSFSPRGRQRLVKRLALMVLVLLVMVACSVDAGSVATNVAGAKGAAVTPTPLPMEQNIVVPPGGRFTVVCADHHAMEYGDNSDEGNPPTGVAGVCAE